ncbi:hypothetical protein EJB05_43050, partial [Eragrostis curvula]
RTGEGSLFVVARADFTGDEVFWDFVPSPEAQRLLVPFAESGEAPCVLAMVQYDIYPIVTDVPQVRRRGRGHRNAPLGDGRRRRIPVHPVLDVSPFHDRTLLRARSPPHVPFEHPVCSPSYLNGVPRPFVTRRYTVPHRLLAHINSSCAEKGASTYCAVTAHLWRAMCIARGLPGDSDTRLRVSVYIRHLLRPPLPASYFGNATIRDLVTVKVGDVLSQPLGSVADRIKRAVSRVDDAFVRSVIDHLELDSEKGSQASRGLMPESDLWVASWLGLPIYDADFGWGRPGFVAPAQMQGSGTAYVTQVSDKEDPVTVIFALEPDYLQCFEKAFYGE